MAPPRSLTLASSGLDPEDLLVLLEDGPQSTGQLVIWLGQPQPRVRAALTRLHRQGRVTRVGEARRWALVPGASSGPSSPLAPPRPTPRVAAEAFETDPLDVDEEPDADAALADELLAVPVRRGRGRPKTLRQDESVPTTVRRDQAPAWWVGVGREELNAQAQARAHGMSASKEGRKVSGTGLL